MRLELEHFYIGDSLGGQQEWFPERMMNLGGCGIVTACDSSIFLSQSMGLKALYPFDDQALSVADYLAFSQVMKPFLEPRNTGIDRLDIYIEGFEGYLALRGETSLTVGGFDGESDANDAADVIQQQLAAGFPVPYLLLLHRDPQFDDYQWHWFLLTGLDRPDPHSARGAQVKAVTYGKGVWFDLEKLWDTRHRRKGGMILFNKK